MPTQPIQLGLLAGMICAGVATITRQPESPQPIRDRMNLQQQVSTERFFITVSDSPATVVISSLGDSAMAWPVSIETVDDVAPDKPSDCVVTHFQSIEQGAPEKDTHTSPSLLGQSSSFNRVPSGPHVSEPFSTRGPLATRLNDGTTSLQGWGRALSPEEGRSTLGIQFTGDIAQPAPLVRSQRSLKSRGNNDSQLPEQDNRVVLRVPLSSELVGQPDRHVAITARILAVGRSVRVMLDDRMSSGHIHANLISNVVHIMDNDVIPGFESRFGGVPDIDNNGRFTVVITPWLDSFCCDGTPLNGLVLSSDFDDSIPDGNRADVLYLNPSMQPGPLLQTILVHEFTHALICGQRARANERPLDDWLNEAMAHVAESIWGTTLENLAPRIQAFRESPNTSPLVVADYRRAGRWRDDGCRGAAFLFLTWCVEQFGSEILNRIVAARGTGRDAISEAVGQPFDDIFAQWAGDLARTTHREFWNNRQQQRTLSIHGTSAVHVGIETANRPVTLLISAPPEARLRIQMGSASVADRALDRVTLTEEPRQSRR